MKKIMTMMLGLAFLAGTVSITFAQQEQPKAEKREKQADKQKRERDVDGRTKEAPKKKAM
jgi:hypothetical protein